MSDHAAANDASPADPKPTPSGNAERAGEWVTPAVSYVEPSRRFCAYCGRPIARRYWRESTPAGDLAFCQPAHAAMNAAAPARFPTEQPERTGG
ncbi:MAG TPA: hypothetical protein VFI22_05000 [Thermomicrobiales bacterium]|nr:hypothetical protein [Thermomicrobiales bacterium]